MTQPLDPNEEFDDATEFDWGPGMFPPGVAQNEGQSRAQDNFGVNMVPPQEGYGDIDDNYARAVADRRTDPTDPNSGRDFESLGNPDRYGGAPPLVRADPQPNIQDRSGEPPVGLPPLQRKW